MTDPRTLAVLDESWTRALAVVAHPDDMEFGAAAAVARWTGQGKDVVYCMVTSGEAGIDGVPPTESGPLREAEEIESARIVGVSTVAFLRLPDGVLEYSIALRRAIAGVIRTHRPEIVITNNLADRWPGGALNQADHIAVGRATLDAVRDAANRWVFPEQLAEGRDRWAGVRQVWTASSPGSGHAVDITDTFATGVASLRAHRAYLDGLGWPDDQAASTLSESARRSGERFGARYAAEFEVLAVGD